MLPCDRAVEFVAACVYNREENCGLQSAPDHYCAAVISRTFCEQFCEHAVEIFSSGKSDKCIGCIIYSV